MKATKATFVTFLVLIKTGCLAECDEKGDTIGTVNGQFGRVAAINTFTGTFLTGETRSVCQILNERRGNRDGTSCNNYARTVSSAIQSIFSFVDVLKSNTHYEGSTAAAKWVADSSNATLLDILTTSLALQGLEYESLTNLHLPAVSRRTAGERYLKGHVLIKGVKHGDMTFNAIQADFDNGDGHIFITPATVNTSESLQKRELHDGPGFKLSFTSRVRSGLDKSMQVELSNSIAGSWNFQANYRRLGEWIGLTKLADKPQAVFYLRIIPERYSYGDNYESVDICGQMARFI